MILAAGLSPAWQHILRFDSFRVGVVNRAHDVQRYGSGKVLNVGYALDRLGGACKLISPLGGAARQAIAAEFGATCIDARWIGTAAATRICTTILDQSTGTTTELVENAEPISAAELAEFVHGYTSVADQAQVVVLSGSIPTGTEKSFYRDLLRIANCPAIVDARGPELLAALEEQPLLVKPNREELATTVGRPLDDDIQLLAAMRALNDRGAQWVMVTHGTEPVWVSACDGVYRFWPAHVDKVINPIGSGDSLAAGIAWALRDGRGMLDAIRFGLGCAANNVEQLLAARISRGRAEELAANVRVESVV